MNEELNQNNLNNNENNLNNNENNINNNENNNQNNAAEHLYYTSQEISSHGNYNNINDNQNTVVSPRAYRSFFRDIIRLFIRIVIIGAVIAVGIIYGPKYGPKIVDYIKGVKIDIPALDVAKNKEITRDVKFIAQELEFRFSLISYDSSDIKEISDICYRNDNEDVKGLITKFVSTYKYDKITCSVSNNTYNFDLYSTSKYNNATFKITCPISNSIECDMVE